MRFKTTSSGDFYFNNGRGALLSSAAQRVSQMLKLVRGEWFLDTTAGVPYYTTAIGQKPSAVTLAAYIKKQILLTLDVLELVSYTQEIDTETRKLTITARIRTNDDDEIVTVTEAI